MDLAKVKENNVFEYIEDDDENKIRLEVLFCPVWALRSQVRPGKIPDLWSYWFV